jgi:hypothetical protein
MAEIKEVGGIERLRRPILTPITITAGIRVQDEDEAEEEARAQEEGRFRKAMELGASRNPPLSAPLPLFLHLPLQGNSLN